MFEKISKTSKYLILLGTILYFFGFISITAHLAQFGIVSFDIVNARYIVAGIFSLIPILIIVLMIWEDITQVLHPIPFVHENIYQRIGAHIGIFTTVFLLSNVLSLLLNIGRGVILAPQNILFFKPLGKFDYLGIYFSELNIHFTPFVNFLIKFVFTYAGYALLIYVLIKGLIVIYKKLVKYKNTIKSENETVDTNRKKLKVPLPHSVLVAIEIILIVFSIGVGYYSYSKLKVNIFGFNSFENIKLNPGLVFAWCYSLILPLALTLWLIGVKAKKTVSELYKEYTSDPSILNSLLGLGVIPIIISLLIFGKVIFPRVPYVIGGGEPREITLGIKGDSKFEDSETKIYQIGETQEFIFIIQIKNDKNEAYQINKDIINFIKTNK